MAYTHTHTDSLRTSQLRDWIGQMGQFSENNPTLLIYIYCLFALDPLCFTIPQTEMIVRTKGRVLLTVKLMNCLLISQLALQQSRSRGDCKNSQSLPSGFLETIEARRVWVRKFTHYPEMLLFWFILIWRPALPAMVVFVVYCINRHQGPIDLVILVNTYKRMLVGV